MLDHKQQFNGTQLHCFSPTYKNHVRRNSTGDTDFDFWGTRKAMFYEGYTDHRGSGNELEFQAQVHAHLEEDFGVYSPPLWKANTANFESSPLLPNNHCYSNLSPNARKQVIADGRKELMEMIKNMPESCYELSLKDIVDEQHGLQEGQEENIVTKAEGSYFNTESQFRKPKKKIKNFRAGQISRTASMESETFLLKMFFPTSLGSNKKAKAGNRSKSKVTSGENGVNKVRWIKGLFIAGKNKRIWSSSRSESASSSNSSSTRYGESNFVPGCWPFLGKKSKSTGQTGCIF
ncbi:hypothetical protein UlMin_037667 [Ulmus minor]